LAFEGLILFLAIKNRKTSLCYSFFVYLVINFVADLAFATLKMSPTTAQPVYLWLEFVVDFVCIVLVLEVNYRVFKLYPRVQRANQVIFFFAIVFFFVYHWLTPQTRNDWWFSVGSDLDSKIMQATCIVLLFMSGSILFYRLHIPASYKYLLVGFLVSQFAVALGFAIMAAFGQETRVLLSSWNSTFFLLALIIWTRVYWADG
jgi:hypothetical protein